MLGDVSAGAGGGLDSDLALATWLAVQIDTEFGLGASGAACFGAADMHALSEADRQRARVRLEKAEHRAIQLLRSHMPLITKLADRLVNERELKGDELEEWLAPSLLRPPL